MLLFDIPLLITAILFLILSYLYGWGLLFFFRNNFRWHRASVVGILSVVSCTATLVWYPRYGELAWEIFWSLFIIFSAALPGMIMVDLVLKKDTENREKEIIRLRREIKSQDEMMNSIRIIIKQEGEKAVNEIIKVLEVREQARGVLEKHFS